MLSNRNASWVALCFFFLFISHFPRCACAARLLRIHVYYNDSLILKGTTSDNGNLSSDEVWDLVCNLFEIQDLGLEPVGDFMKLVKKEDDGKSYTIQTTNKDKILIHIDVGGELHVKGIRLYYDYVKGDTSEKKWIIDHQMLRKYKKSRRRGY